MGEDSSLQKLALGRTLTAAALLRSSERALAAVRCSLPATRNPSAKPTSCCLTLDSGWPPIPRHVRKAPAESAEAIQEGRREHGR